MLPPPDLFKPSGYINKPPRSPKVDIAFGAVTLFAMIDSMAHFEMRIFFLEDLVPASSGWKTEIKLKGIKPTSTSQSNYPIIVNGT
jgi:hypothetical protein